MPHRWVSLRAVAFLLPLLIIACSQQAPDPEFERLRIRAHNVTIIRNDFGVPHVYAKADADAIFGMLYAQSEDDFNRIEQSYIWATGRLAELEGQGALITGGASFDA